MVSLGVLLAALALRALAAYRGDVRRAAASPVIVVLPLVAFFIQEHVERFVYTGQMPWTAVLEPSFLVGLALQLPFALAALLVAWALDSGARAIGLALAATPRPALSAFVPALASAPAAPRLAGLARGYGERAPPFARRL
jgi:hypothetical protein